LGVSALLTVAPAAADHFTVTAPTSAATGSPVNVTVTALDAYGNVATGYSGNVHFTSSDASASLPADAPLAGGVGVFGLTLRSNGSQTITASDATSSAITGSSTIRAVGLTVTSFTPTATGFTATFSKPFKPGDITLYGSGGTVMDVTLVGAASGPISGPIQGTLLIDPTNTSITFKATANFLLTFLNTPVLPDDTYTVTLVSGSGTNGFMDALGAGLDGANNGGHANYTTTFTTANQANMILALPDFARGPDGTHPIKVPNDTAHGIPVTLYNAANVTDVAFTLSYNPSVLTVTAGTTGDATGTGTVTFTRVGFRRIDATHTTANFVYHNDTAQSGTVVLGDIVADVPSPSFLLRPIYRTKELLGLGAIKVNGADFTGVTADGVHVNAYFGDVTGNGKIDGLDVMTANTVAQGTATGFAAFTLLDPAIIGDVANDASVDAGDVSTLAAFVSRLPTPTVPAIPTGLNILQMPGADPTLSLAQNGMKDEGGFERMKDEGGRMNQSGDMTHPSSFILHPCVSVMLDQPHPTGSTGLDEAILALTYDPSLLSVSAADITLGSIPGLGAGWRLDAVVDAVTGQIGIALYSTTPIAADTAGSLVHIGFHVNQAADAAQLADGAAVRLVNRVIINGQEFTTQLSDAQSQLVLSPGVDRLLVDTAEAASSARVTPVLGSRSRGCRHGRR
jgi:hypothetical protein